MQSQQNSKSRAVGLCCKVCFVVLLQPTCIAPTTPLLPPCRQEPTNGVAVDMSAIHKLNSVSDYE